MRTHSDKQLVVGLDIGTSKVVAVVGEYEVDQPLTIIGIGTHPAHGLKRGVVVDIDSTVHSIQRAVEEAELMAGCQIRSVYASIAGSHIKDENSHGTAPIRDREVSAGDLDMLGVDGVTTKIVERVGDARAYLTFDIDCLDPAFAPGTGTPVAGGLSSREALAVLRRLGGLKLVGGDVVEVAPPYDHADITAIAAATVAMYYIGLLAERRLG